jgi:OsmC-like protein
MQGDGPDREQRIPTASSLVTVTSQVPTPKKYSTLRTPRASPCHLPECLKWRASCLSRWTANRTSSSKRMGTAFSITSVHLTVTAKIPGIDRDTFQPIASKARAWCPVSKLMNAAIGLEATLVA